MMRTPRRRKPPNRYSPDSQVFRKTPGALGANRRDFDLDISDFPPLSPLAQSTQQPSSEQAQSTQQCQQMSTQQNQADFDATFLRISTVTPDENNNVTVTPPSPLPQPTPPSTQQLVTFSRGDFVYAKSGARPHWPARVLSIESEQKCQVFLYGLHLPVAVMTKNVVPVTDESRNF